MDKFRVFKIEVIAISSFFSDNLGQQKETFSFPPCKLDEVYITLDENHYLLSENPYFFQNESGRVIGLNTNFSQFYVYDNTDKLIQELEIVWNTNCLPIETEVYTPTSNDVKRDILQFYPVFIIIFCILVFILLIQWRKKHV